MVLRVSNCSPHPSGLLRLDDFAALRVSGEDRVDFLQGQLSQDMGRVTPSQAAPAAWCNRQGRVLCLTVAVDWQDAIFLILPAGMAETCADGLGRYILRARVRIEVVPEPIFGCKLPAGEHVPAPGEGETPSFPGEAWQCSGAPEFCAVRVPGDDSRAMVLGKPPAELAAGGDSVWTAERWRLADIEAEIPWVDSDTSGKFLAHSLNLDLSGAVSFTKGCYVGQEIIARMEHRGRPKRRMRRLRLPPGVEIRSGARAEHPELGAVTVIGAALAGEQTEVLAEVRLTQDPGQLPKQQ
ncbi:MAG: folate-binding protein YgfZ [Gammaproteobacteria bacterium]|nr:folate-binding protein YgfZ [Gammaproteobacteria bacterium]